MNFYYIFYFSHDLFVAKLLFGKTLYTIFWHHVPAWPSVPVTHRARVCSLCLHAAGR